MAFGKTSSALSEIFWEQLELLIKRNGHLLTEIRREFVRKRCQEYCKAIEEKGCLMEGCWGFIDGSKVKICRAGGHNLIQRAAHSGHKRVHCLNFQTITAPDGIILRAYGPLEGRRHDSTLYRKSGIDGSFGSALLINNKQHCAYRDPAFPHRPWLQLGHQGRCLDEILEDFNRSMNSARICAEWSYESIKQDFSSVGFSRKMKAK